MTHPSLNGHTAYIFPQVQRVANRFGGTAALSVALKRVKRYHPHASVTSMSIGRWNLGFEYPGGMSGLIPPWNFPAILHAARLHGIVITANDLFGGRPIPALVSSDRRGRPVGRRNAQPVIRRKKLGRPKKKTGKAKKERNI